jgi:hypothetical protein
MPWLIETPSPADLHHLARLWHEWHLLTLQSQTFFADAPQTPANWVTQAKVQLTHADRAILQARKSRDHAPIGFVAAGIVPAPFGMIPDRLVQVDTLVLDAHGYHAGAGRELVQALGARFQPMHLSRMVIPLSVSAATQQAFWRSLGANVWMQTLMMPLPSGQSS